MLLLGLLIGLVLLALVIAGISVFRVDEGHVAVVTRFGAARIHHSGLLRVHGPGLHIRAPWDSIIIAPTHEQTLAFVGEQDGHRIMAADGTVLRFDCAVRWVPVVPALDRLLFDLTAPLVHIKDLFACILRAEVAAFEATQDRDDRDDHNDIPGYPHEAPDEADWIRHAGSYATIRRELTRLRTRIETACRVHIGERYGVTFIAVDIVDILPPDDLADGLNAIIQAEAESSAAFFRAQGECQQRTLSARDGVAIARAHALAAETELRTLGHHLGELERSGTLADYVARRRDETYAECRTLFLKEPPVTPHDPTGAP
jgi:regulator of protease activity HflC (stomatin/prohibitin superfamily)